MAQAGVVVLRWAGIGILPAGLGEYRLPRGMERYAFAGLVLLLQLLAIWLVWRASAVAVLRGGREQTLLVQMVSEPDRAAPALAPEVRQQPLAAPRRQVAPRSKTSDAPTGKALQPTSEFSTIEPPGATPTPNAPKRLDTEALREALRQSMRAQGPAPAIAGLMPEPIEPPNKLARDIERSVRADCRHAYDSAGLLAVIPLAIDTLRDKGCKW